MDREALSESKLSRKQTINEELAHLENTLDFDSEIIWKRRNTYCHPCMLSRISKDLDEHV